MSKSTHGHPIPTEEWVDGLPHPCFLTQTPAIISPEMVYLSFYHLSSWQSRCEKFCFCLPQAAKFTKAPRSLADSCVGAGCDKGSLSFRWHIWSAGDVETGDLWMWISSEPGKITTICCNLIKITTVLVMGKNSTSTHVCVISLSTSCCTNVFEKCHLPSSFGLCLEKEMKKEKKKWE